MIDPSASPRRASSRFARWVPLALIVLAAAALYAAGAQRYLSLASIAEHRQALQALVDSNLPLALGAYLSIYIVAVALSLPGAVLLTVLGGFLFGWLAGGAMAVLAATAGASIIFLAARSSLGELLSRRAGPWLSKLAEGFRSDAFNYLLFLRLVPLFPFWLVNIAPAAFNVRLKTFVLATFIGIIPATFAFSLLGSGLDGIIEAQRRRYEACVAARGVADCSMTFDAAALITPQLIVALAALGVIALVPIIVRRFKARSASGAITTPHV